MSRPTGPRSVFITGAAGFIGVTLAERYRSLGAEVRGVDLIGDGDAIVAGDVSTDGDWQAHAAGCELVIHTAALVTNTAPATRFWEVNVLSARKALDAAVEGGADRFVQISSVRAFSDVDFPDGVDERHPIRTDGHQYVDTKIAGEQVVLQAHAAGEIDVTVIRPGDVYGPGSKPWTVWPALGMPNGFFFVPDDGAGIFSPVYVDNLVDGIVLAADSPAGAGQVFIVSDGIAMTNTEFFGHYARMLGIELPYMPTSQLQALFDQMAIDDVAAGREPGLNGETVDYFARTGTYSIAKARSVLGYEPAIDLTEGMARTEVWLRDNGFLPG